MKNAFSTNQENVPPSKHFWMNQNIGTTPRKIPDIRMQPFITKTSVARVQKSNSIISAKENNTNQLPKPKTPSKISVNSKPTTPLSKSVTATISTTLSKAIPFKAPLPPSTLKNKILIPSKTPVKTVSSQQFKTPVKQISKTPLSAKRPRDTPAANEMKNAMQNQWKQNLSHTIVSEARKEIIQQRLQEIVQTFSFLDSTTLQELQNSLLSANYEQVLQTMKQVGNNFEEKVKYNALYYIALGGIYELLGEFELVITTFDKAVDFRAQPFAGLQREFQLFLADRLADETETKSAQEPSTKRRKSSVTSLINSTPIRGSIPPLPPTPLRISQLPELVQGEHLVLVLQEATTEWKMKFGLDFMITPRKANGPQILQTPISLMVEEHPKSFALLSEIAEENETEEQIEPSVGLLEFNENTEIDKELETMDALIDDDQVEEENQSENSNTEASVVNKQQEGIIPEIAEEEEQSTTKDDEMQTDAEVNENVQQEMIEVEEKTTTEEVLPITPKTLPKMNKELRALKPLDPNKGSMIIYRATNITREAVTMVQARASSRIARKISHQIPVERVAQELKICSNRYLSNSSSVPSILYL